MSRSRRPRKKSSFVRKLIKPMLVLGLAGMVVFLSYAIYLDIQVIEKFEGARWEIPSRVYARPLDLYTGKQLDQQDLLLELGKLRYKNRNLDKPGSFYTRGNDIYLHTRSFMLIEDEVPATRLRIRFEGSRVDEIRELTSNKIFDLWTLEPVFIGGIYPKLNEDRVLVKLDEVPATLTKTLVAVEDRNFYSHYGVAPLSILRAIVANLQAGARVQGGSTLTQQLVKNFYLSNEKTITRKLNEAIMALLLEMHYSKDEILEAYLNEVFLGQDGKRAIHGFGLAAQFYFDTSLENLSESQMALLVGLVKGASYYDPRRHPERALSRRQVVQKLQLEQGIISNALYKQQVNAKLEVSKDKPSGVSPYPYFLDLVKRQLRRDYAPQDLQSAGLKLYTTLDPIIQYHTEQSAESQLRRLESAPSRAKNSLQVAAVVSDPGTGLVRALVGGRDFRNSGFNRVLDSERQIGSLIKPFVYLTALQRESEYHLNSQLLDQPISLTLENGEDWTPENYDKKYHGETSLMSALANSYNAATVRLGLSVGLENVIANLNKLGVERELKNYPSLLLGAVDLSLFDIMQAYQTLAAQGFRTPLRSINTVTKSSGEVVSRYPLTVEQVIEPHYVYLILQAMQGVMSYGTGKYVYQKFPAEFGMAGKTGTSNDYRDSWFAGMTGDKLAVVWIGADNNASTGVSGSTGALRLWTDIMAKTYSQSLTLIPPERIAFVKVNLLMNENGQSRCIENYVMPYISSRLPSERERISCLND